MSGKYIQSSGGRAARLRTGSGGPHARARGVSRHALRLGLLLTIVVVGLSVLAVGGAAADPVDLDPDADLAGNGTVSHPYIVTNASELQAITDNTSAHYRLGADIDASDTAEWNVENGTPRGFIPIGMGTSLEFEGSLDGDGYSVSGLYINRSKSGLGLFERIGAGATIEDLVLEDVDITVVNNTDVTLEDSGGLAGINLGQVRNVSVKGTVSGDETVGGLVGDNFGIIQTSSAAVTVDGSHYVGGLVGWNRHDPNTTITESYATGSVSATTSYVGGLVGVNSATIQDSYATGSVNGTGLVGGLVGHATFGYTVNRSYATGTVTYAESGGGLTDGTNFFSSNTANSFWDSNRSGQGGASPGTSLHTQAMQGSRSETEMSSLFSSGAWERVAGDYPDLVNNSRTVSTPHFEAPDDDEMATILADLEFADGRYNVTSDKALQALNRNTTTRGWEYRLVVDVDASETDQWFNGSGDPLGFEPIGNLSEPFTGSFNGSGHTVRGVSINRSNDDYVGLFGYIDSNSRVEYVGVDGVDIRGNTFVGGLVGNSYEGTVSQSYANGMVVGNTQVGGLVGNSFSGVVSESYVRSTVTAVGATPSKFGGLVGSNTGTGIVNTSYAAGTVDEADAVTVGGLVGQNTGTVETAYWDRAATGQAAAIGDGTVGPAVVGFGAAGDTGPAAEMQGFVPRVTMFNFSFESPTTWALTGSYPALAWQSIIGPTVDRLVAEDITTTAGSDRQLNVTVIESGVGAGPGVTVEVVANDSLTGPAVGGTALTDENGNATFTVTGGTEGTYDIRFAWADGDWVTDTATVTVDGTRASSISVDTEPQDSTAGEPLMGPPRATVTDTFGDPVDGVTVTVSELGGYNFDGGSTTNQTVNGTATFDDLVINESAEGYQLTFSINGNDGNVDADAAAQSATFNVTAADADSLAVVSAPATTAGEAVTLVVNATDAFGNPAAGQALTNVQLESEFDGIVFGPQGVTLNDTGRFEATISTDTLTTANDTHTITVTADGVTEDSVDIAVDSAAANSLSVDTQPSPTVAGEALAGPPTVTVTDSFGNLIRDENVTASVNGSATLLGTTAVATNGSGVGVFDDLRIQDAGAYEITVTVDADTAVNATTNPFEITPASPNAVAITTQPTATTAGEIVEGPPTVTVTDAFGNAIAEENVTVTLNDSVNLGGTIEVRSNSSGVAVFDSLRIDTAGHYTLTLELAENNAVNTTTESFEIESAGPDSITVDTQPEATTAGETIEGPPAVTITDTFGNPIEDTNVTAILNGSETLLGTTDVATNDSGVAVFETLRVETVGTYTLGFELVADSGVNVTTETFELSAAEAETVVVDSQPADAIAGSTIGGSPTVTVTDRFDNPVIGENVTAVLNGSEGLFGTTTVMTNETGLARFTNLRVETAGNYTLTFKITDNTTVNTTTEGFSIEAAAADSITVDSQPALTTAGETIVGPPTANVTDGFGNPIEGANVTIGLNDSAMLTGPTEIATNASGLAVFETLRVSEAGSYRLIFELTANDAVNATTNAFEIEAASADSITVDSHPVDGTAGETVGGPPVANVTDSFGNPVEGTNVTVSINGSADLLGTVQVETNSSGVAAFDDLQVEKRGSYTLTVELTADSTVNATTDAFDIESASADSITVDDQPATTTAGERIGGSPTANVTDAFGNPVAGENVTAVLNGSVDLIGTTDIETNDSGLAVFETLRVSKAGSYTLSFKLTGNDAVNATTDVFGIESAAAESVDIETQPETTTAGEDINGPPTINVTDAFGNAIAGENVTASLNGSTDLLGTTEGETNESGLAVFDALQVQKVGSYTLSFELADNTTVNATTAVFTVQPASADSITVVSQPVTATAGETVGGSPTVNVTDRFGNPVTGENVTAVLNGSVDLLGTTAVETNDSGLAVFEALRVSNAGSYTLTVELTADNTVNATTDAFEIESADPEGVGIETQPETTTAGDEVSGPPTINVTDAFGNAIAGENVTVSLNGSADLLGTTESESNESGLAVFDGLRVEKAGNYTLTVELTDETTVNATSEEFTIEAAAADSITVDSQPATTTANETIGGPPTATVTDSFGNPVVGENVTVGLNDSATLTGPTELATNSSGLAVFETLRVSNVGSYTLTVELTADSTVNATTDAFEIKSAAPESLGIETQPETTTAGDEISGPLSINVTDAFGNTITGENVTASLNGSANLLGTTEGVTNESGLAVFDALRVEKAGNYTLTVELTANDAVNVTTAAFEIEAAGPDSVTVDTQPATTTAGEPLVGPPTANVTDAFGNHIAGENVTAVLNGSVDLIGTTDVVTNASGLASFATLSVEEAGSYTLTIALTENTTVNATTDTFEIESADTDSITVDIQPTATPAGTPILGHPTATVADEFGNPINGTTVSADLNVSDTLLGTLAVETNETGLATFDNLSVEAVGIYTLTFETGGNLNVTTATFEITTADADTLNATNRTETAGVEGAVRIKLTDEFGNGVNGTNINITDDGGLTIVDNASTNASGVALFTVDEETAGVYDLEFGVASNGSVTDIATVTIEPAAPATVDVTASAGNLTISDDFTDDNTLVGTVTVADAFDNVVPNATVDLTHNGTDIEVQDGRSKQTGDNGTVAFNIQSTTVQDDIRFNFTEQESGQQNAGVIEGFDFESVESSARGSASSYTVSVGTNVTFRAGGSTVPDGSNPAYDWEWAWDDGAETRVGTGLTNTTSFDLPGTVNTTLNVTVAGETATDEFTITVEDRQPPMARLTAPSTVDVGESFTFDATGSTDTVGIADYEWEFGNGTAVNGTARNETVGNYSVPGEYDVVLTVTDTSNNTATNTTSVFVAGANATVSTESLDFGEIGTNATSTESVDIDNDGTAPLNVTESTITGPNATAFSILGEDEPRIRPGENRSLTVAFEPLAVGSHGATLQLATENNTGANSVEIDLTGTGIESNLTSTDSTVAFGATEIGTTTQRNVTISNDGTDTAELDSATVLGSDAGVFRVVDGGSLPTIPAGNAENITVIFEPIADGDRSGTLRIETTDGDTTTVALNGTGEGPQIYTSSTNRSFGTVGVGTEDTTTVTISNYGSQTLNITGLELSGGDSGVFAVDTDTSVLVVAPDDTESVELTFAPTASETYTATLEVAHNDSTAANPVEIVLEGRGVAADIDVDQTTLDFGTTIVGDSEFLNLTLTNENNAGATLSIDSSSIVGRHAEDFRIDSPAQPFDIAPGAERALTVNFTAGDEGRREAQLQINSDAGNQPQINVWLTNTRSYIIVREISNPTVNIDGRNLESKRNATVNVSTPSTRESNVTVDELGLEMQRDGDFEMNLINNESAFDTAFVADSETRLVQYVGIEHLDHLANETFDNTSLVYRVDTDALPAESDPDDVVIHRFNETTDEYVALDSEFLGTSGGRYRYRVETPGFSEFAITAADPSTDDETGGNGGSGGSGGSPGTEGPSLPESETTLEPKQGPYDIRVDIETPGRDSTVVIDGASTGRETLSGIGTIRVDSLSLDLVTDRPFSLDISTYENDLTPSFDTDRLDAATEARLKTAAVDFESQTRTVSAGYLDIQHDLGTEELSEATIAFRVRKPYLDALGVDPESVTLYRQTADGWTPLPTVRRGGTEADYAYAGTTPGFSVFALGTEAPTFAVTDATLAETPVTVGETATVTATVENRGQQAGDHTVDLVANGEVVATGTMSLAGGESTDRKLSFVPATAEEYTVKVGGVDVGTLTVASVDGEQSFGWLLLGGVGAASILLILLWRRHRNETVSATEEL